PISPSWRRWRNRASRPTTTERPPAPPTALGAGQGLPVAAGAPLQNARPVAEGASAGAPRPIAQVVESLSAASDARSPRRADIRPRRGHTPCVSRDLGTCAVLVGAERGPRGGSDQAESPGGRGRAHPARRAAHPARDRRLPGADRQGRAGGARGRG